MKTLLFIAAGGAFGALGRHGVNSLWLRAMGADFPGGTMIVNVLGAFLIGMLAGYLLNHGVSTDMRAFVVIGLLGAFTTFSTFSLDAVVLLQRGDITAAVLYIGGSVILGILSILAGMYLTKGLGVV